MVNRILSTRSIVVTIDTDAVRADLPDPSLDPNGPKAIAHDMAHMIVSGVGGAGGGSGDVRILARIGARVRIFATSGSSGFEDALLVYGFARRGDGRVLGLESVLDHRSITRPTVVPGSTGSPLPARIEDQEFWFHEARITGHGIVHCIMRFALYTRDAETGELVLFGYYSWDPSITVAR